MKRLAKEKVTYEKEAAQQRERIQKLKEQGENAWKMQSKVFCIFFVISILSIAVLFIQTFSYPSFLFFI